ncbi:MAG TPA: PQQ-binding-like beta-propeller repeat protein [Candidatus Paceibacterota bacterium]|nr:PQQ-binding-like beta-propeller repeat protein [Verrucomicrobiota bacterium]HSA09489.1 PQQ-binding-like beta-propeller repeat protein [Candidatus Paceibacterota bacterium]
MRSAFTILIGLLGLLPPSLAVGAPNRLTNAWTLDLRGKSDSAPAVATNGTIYVGTRAGKLWAINPNGTPKWIFSAQDEIKSAPALGSDGTVYFGSRDRKFYAVHANGKLRWEFQTRGWVDSSPALAHDGTVYFGSWDRNFYAFGPGGKEKWRFATQGEIVSSPAIGLDGTVYFGSHDRKFYALSPDGQKRWEFATSGPILSSPALNRDQCLYFTSVDGCLYALNLDGSLRWRLRTGGTTESSPVLGLDGTIYVGVVQHLWAISPDGKKKWGTVGGEDYPFHTTPVVLAGGAVCCVSRYGMLCYASPEGVLEWQYYLFGYGYGSPAIGPNGDIYVPDSGAAMGRGFTALRAGATLAPSPWPRFRANPRNTGNAQDAAP